MHGQPHTAWRLRREKFLLKGLLASLGLFAFFGMPTRGAATLSDDLSQLRMLESSFATAMSKKDIEGVMAVYAPEKALFVFDVVGPPGVHFGWNEYREAFKQMFGAIRGPLRFTMSDLDIHVSGDFGYSRSLQRVSGIRVKGAKSFDYTVRVTDVYQKINGKWLIVQEHLSLPIDRNTFTPLLHLSFPANR